MTKKLISWLAVSLLAMAGLAGVSGSPVYAAPSSPTLPNVANAKHAHAPGAWRFGGSNKKTPAPSPFTGPGYYHAGAAQVLSGGNTAGGTSSKMYEAAPFIPSGQCVSGGDHSLMELSVRDAVGNVVEVGWAAEPSAFGDCKPRLFASTWKGNGSGGGTWNGCYDGHTASCWFVDNTANPINLGADLSATAALCNGSSLNCVKTFQAYWSPTNCGPDSSGIFITYDLVSVGCFYSPAFYNATTPSSFTTFQGFGEYYYSGATKPCGDMGNGKSPTLALGVTGPSYIGPVSFANPNPSTLTTSYTAQPSTDGPAYDVGTVSGGKTFATSGAGYTLSGGSWVTPGVTSGC